MARLRHVVLAVVFTVLQLFNGVLSQVSQCVFPSSSIIHAPLVQSIASSGGEGAEIENVTILDLHVTCLAVRELDMYREASVVVRYNSAMSTNVIDHFTVSCFNNNNNLFYNPKEREPNVAASLFNVQTRYDCAACSNSGGGSLTIDMEANCIGKSAEIFHLFLIMGFTCPLFYVFNSH